MKTLSNILFVVGLGFVLLSSTEVQAQSSYKNAKLGRLPRYECDGKLYAEPCKQNKKMIQKKPAQPKEKREKTIDPDQMTEDEKQALAIREFDEQRAMTTKKRALVAGFDEHLQYYQKTYNILPREAKEVKSYCMVPQVTIQQCRDKLSDVKVLLTDYEVKYHLNKGEYFQPYDKKWKQYREKKKLSQSHTF
ncbi:MAG: hypothetical protein IT292_10215 [Deltaproteobacteria bacterium]|nr:hypothetical protein [Deltaproteobacteria bacterium]